MLTKNSWLDVEPTHKIEGVGIPVCYFKYVGIAVLSSK